jgi:hypothetical protein
LKFLRFSISTFLPNSDGLLLVPHWIQVILCYFWLKPIAVMHAGLDIILQHSAEDDQILAIHEFLTDHKPRNLSWIVLGGLEECAQVYPVDAASAVDHDHTPVTNQGHTPGDSAVADSPNHDGNLETSLNNGDSAGGASGSHAGLLLDRGDSGVGEPQLAGETARAEYRARLASIARDLVKDAVAKSETAQIIIMDMQLNCM